MGEQHARSQHREKRAALHHVKRTIESKQQKLQLNRMSQERRRKKNVEHIMTGFAYLFRFVGSMHTR